MNTDNANSSSLFKICVDLCSSVAGYVWEAKVTADATDFDQRLRVLDMAAFATRMYSSDSARASWHAGQRSRCSSSGFKSSSDSMPLAYSSQASAEKCRSRLAFMTRTFLGGKRSPTVFAILVLLPNGNSRKKRDQHLLLQFALPKFAKTSLGA